MTEAEQERKRITDIIRVRKDRISRAIDDLANNNIRVPLTLFSLTNELYLLLREIEREQNI